MIARLILAASRTAATITWLHNALNPGIPCTPRQCGTCDHTTERLTVEQVRAQTPDGSVPCTRRDCSGEMRTAGKLARLRDDARTEGPLLDQDGCGLVVDW